MIHVIHAMLWMMHAVDRWSVVLKGETPDYISASNMHVTTSVYILDHVTQPLVINHQYITGLQTSKRLHHHSRSHAVHCKGLLEDGV